MTLIPAHVEKTPAAASRWPRTSAAPLAVLRRVAA